MYQEAFNSYQPSKNATVVKGYGFYKQKPLLDTPFYLIGSIFMPLAKPIPMFSVPRRDENNYYRYYNTRCLIQSRSAKYPDYYKNPEGSRLLCEKMGRKNLSKFMRRRDLWNKLQIPIPQHYLELIGISYEDIKNAVQLDQQYYDEMLKTETTYTESYLVFKWAIKSIRFPRELSEEEAIDFSRQQLLKEKIFRQVLINRMPLYQIYVLPQKTVYDYNRPEVHIDRDLVSFKSTQLPGLLLK